MATSGIQIPESFDDKLPTIQPFSQVDESDYLSLLGLAEFFRTCQPPRVRETIHCLQATLSIETLPLIEKARCRLNLSKLLLQHTKNVGHARAQIEQAVIFVVCFHAMILHMLISLLLYFLEVFPQAREAIGQYSVLEILIIAWLTFWA